MRFLSAMSVLLVFLCMASGCARKETSEQNAGSFTGRGAFQARPVDAPPLLLDGKVRAQKLHRLAIDARPGQTVADVGCGTGYYLFDVAEDVGPTGRILCRDIDEKAIAELSQEIAARGMFNMSADMSMENDVCLPDGEVDLVYLGDVYHIVLQNQGESKAAFLSSLYESMSPGGVAVVTYFWAKPVFDDQQGAELIRATKSDFERAGFVVGRYWRPAVAGIHPHLLEFQRPVKETR